MAPGGMNGPREGGCGPEGFQPSWGFCKLVLSLLQTASRALTRTATRSAYLFCMPLTPYRSVFDPETLVVLQKAFDLAWEEAATLKKLSPDEKSARDLMAKAIVDAARDRGENNPFRLKCYALNALKPNGFVKPE